MPTSTPPKSPNAVRSSDLKHNTPKALTAVRSMNLRRNAPPPIPIPINPIRHHLEIARPKRQLDIIAGRNDIKVAHPPSPRIILPVVPVNTRETTHLPSSTRSTHSPPRVLTLIPVELSNYSPSLTRQDVIELFEDFAIAPGFKMATRMLFAYPLRTIIYVHGRDEAQRAARVLDGTIIGNRRVRVALVDEVEKENEHGKGTDGEEQRGYEYDEKAEKMEDEVVLAEMADEMKIAIINTAGSNYSHLKHKLLEVCEFAQGIVHYAFLQACEHVATDTTREVALPKSTATAKWELVAGGCADGRRAQGRETSGRLCALKRLQETVEEQGMLSRVWGRWNGELYSWAGSVKTSHQE